MRLLLKALIWERGGGRERKEREGERRGERERKKKREREHSESGLFTSKNRRILCVCVWRGDPFPNLNAVWRQNKLPSKDVESLVLEAFKHRDQILEALSVPAKPPDCQQWEQVVGSAFRGSHMCTPSTAHTFAPWIEKKYMSSSHLLAAHSFHWWWKSYCPPETVFLLPSDKSHLWSWYTSAKILLVYP